MPDQRFTRLILQRLGWINLIVSAVAALCIGVLAAHLAGENAVRQIQQRMNETLYLQNAVLNGILDKHRLLAVVLAHQDEVELLLQTPPNPEVRERARVIAQEAALFAGAFDVAIYDRNGALLASGLSAFDVTLDLQSAPIQAALQGRLGRQARVFNNGERAYLFASAVRDDDGTITGFVTVFVNLSELEAPWSLTTDPIYAVSENGSVFIANRPSWRLRSHDKIRDPDRPSIFYVNDREIEHLEAELNLPLFDWELHVLSPIAPVVQARVIWGTIAAIGVVLVGLAVQFFINRWADARKRQRDQRANALHLERQVRDRTKALSQSNNLLEREVAERRATEDLLRRTQAELVQSGKLAALGQMSASISHELNQPLSATRTYAETALMLLDRGREEEAKDNISRIADLAARMANISKHLRNFARKPSPTFDQAELSQVIEESVQLLTPRLQETGAELTRFSATDDLRVVGGPVRLQQVIVNLINNAIDATPDGEKPRISLDIEEGGETVLLKVRDQGSGIAPDIMQSLFDPFMTTKGVGQGLGLGLSISYNIIKDFGGEISARNASPTEGGRGAIFEVKLVKAAPKSTQTEDEPNHE